MDASPLVATHTIQGVSLLSLPPLKITLVALVQNSVVGEVCTAKLDISYTEMNAGLLTCMCLSVKCNLSSISDNMHGIKEGARLRPSFVK
jgi:hypothetical protein